MCQQKNNTALAMNGNSFPSSGNIVTKALESDFDFSMRNVVFLRIVMNRIKFLILMLLT